MVKKTERQLVHDALLTQCSCSQWARTAHLDVGVVVAGKCGAGVHHNALELVHVLPHAAAAAAADCRHILCRSDAIQQPAAGFVKAAPGV